MKNFLSQLNNIFKKNNYKNTHTYNPHYHWIILLRVFFSLFVGLIVFSFYLLYEIKNDVIFSDTVNLVKKDSLIFRNEKLTNDVGVYFKEKQNKMNKLRTEDLKVSDPRITK